AIDDHGTRLERDLHLAIEDVADVPGGAPMRMLQVAPELEQTQLLLAQRLHLEPHTRGARLPRHRAKADAGASWPAPLTLPPPSGPCRPAAARRCRRSREPSAIAEA